MAPTYYTDLFSPETYEAIAKSARDISGFRLNQQPHAQRIKPGDRLVWYMTKLSRWFGVLEVQGECFLDETPLFYTSDDPFVVRFKVKPIVWLPKDKAVPIHEPVVWDHLSFTKDTQPGYLGRTGILRTSVSSTSCTAPAPRKEVDRHGTRKLSRENRLSPIETLKARAR
jgi:hypothetical protein